MYYYFFKTSMEVRDRSGNARPTLRALPNQTFPDGSAVDTAMNVSAPKEAGTSRYGTRLEYPDGTIFCSTFLDTVSEPGKKPFYTVYDEANGEGPTKGNPNFHPVSDDPNFAYVSPLHRSDEMNAAYVNFITFGDQGATDDEESTTSNMSNTSFTPGVRFAPTGKDGKARPAIEGWQPAYEDQVETESELIATWMRKFLNEKGIRSMARRPKIDASTKAILQELYTCGESIDTIASRTRFNQIYTDQRMDAAGLGTIASGPFEWYLNNILNEHKNGTDCSATERNATDATEVEDAAFIVGAEINRQLGTNDSYDAATLANIKKSLESGWTLDDILDPSVLMSQGNISGLATALATGVIPVPVRTNVSGTTLLDTLIANPAYKRPTSKDGFHVEELTWNTLLVNLMTKTNTLLIGPTGTGKTQIVKTLCEKTNTPFTIIPMGSITDPTEQLVGKMDLTPLPNGNVETKYDWADFALAIQRPGVVLLDEINRIPRNGYNALFSVLDGTRQLPAYGAKGTDKRMIDVHPDCVFFATANLGYAGTEELDEALANRFLPMELDYLPIKSEAAVLVACCGISKEDATNIATLATQIRKTCKSGTIQHCVSTRETLKCAQYVKWGFTVEQAMEITFLPRFEGGLTDKDPNCERGTVRAMVATLFKPQAAQPQP